MNLESKDCDVWMDVSFYDTSGIVYSRELWGFDYEYIGDILINEEILNRIETVSDLIHAFRKRTLISYYDKNIGDIDESMGFFVKAYGEEYLPDENESWYILKDGKGLKGAKVVAYLHAYKDNVSEHQRFLKTLLSYENLKLESIKIEVRRFGAKPKIFFKDFNHKQVGGDA